jgi:hypothetical protein
MGGADVGVDSYRNHATPEDNGGIYVFPGAVPLDLSGPLTCDWRDGDVW